MPSLPTKKGNFLYYYDRNINIITAKDLDESFCDSLSLFIKVTFYICLIAWIPLILCIGILQYLYYYQNSYYTVHSLRYISHVIFFIICSIGNSILMLALMKQYQHSQYAKIYGNLLHSIIINRIPYRRIVTITSLNIFFALIPSILLLIFYPNLNENIIVDTSVNVCKPYLHCSPYSWFIFLKESIFPGLYLPVVYFIMYSIYVREVFEGITDDEMEGNLQMILLVENNNNNISNKDDKSVSEQADSSIMISDVRDDPQSNTKHVLWCCLFIVLLCFMMIWINIEYAINFSFDKNDIEFYEFYWQFMALIVCIKFIIKRVGRKIDRIKSMKDDYNHYISIEYIMEWFFSCIYWNWIRTFCVFNDLNVYNYIMVISVHFILEIIETNIKFTEKYFNLTTEWTLSWADNNRGCLCRKLYDNSNIKEWRTRLSMDIMARFYCGFIINILQLLHIGLLGSKGVKQYYDSRTGSTQQQYDKALIYLIIATILELIHYLLTFIFVNKIYKFNILTVFLNYVISMKRLQIIFSILMLIYFVWVY